MHQTIFVCKRVNASQGDLTHRSFTLGSIFETMFGLKCSGIYISSSILFSTLYFTLSWPKMGLRKILRDQPIDGIHYLHLKIGICYH